MDISKTQSPRRERHRNENMGIVIRREGVDEEAGLICTMARTTGIYVDKTVSGRVKLVDLSAGERKGRESRDVLTRHASCILIPHNPLLASPTK